MYRVHDFASVYSVYRGSNAQEGIQVVIFI